MISVLILTRNEQQDLPACLASVAWSDDGDDGGGGAVRVPFRGNRLSIKRTFLRPIAPRGSCPVRIVNDNASRALSLNASKPAAGTWSARTCTR